MPDLPESFARTIREVHGPAGEAWLARLPTLIEALAQRWSLRVAAPFPNLSYNYVAPAVRADGVAVVLKLGVPHPELNSEIEALRLVAGGGMVRLYAADAAQGALLLERLHPGTVLSRLADDDQATLIAAEVMRQLWRPAPPEHGFPTAARWAAGLTRLRTRFAGGTGPLPPHLVEQAEALFADLLASAGEPVLLHGDLHHENILAAQRQPWLALDPKGVVGEREYEVGALLRNPIPGLLARPDPRAVLDRRIHLLAERLHFDRARLRDWALAQAVLSAWWSVEDHGGGWEWALACAEHLAALKL